MAKKNPDQAEPQEPVLVTVDGELVTPWSAWRQVAFWARGIQRMAAVPDERVSIPRYVRKIETVLAALRESGQL